MSFGPSQISGRRHFGRHLDPLRTRTGCCLGKGGGGDEETRWGPLLTLGVPGPDFGEPSARHARYAPKRLTTRQHLAYTVTLMTLSPIRHGLTAAVVASLTIIIILPFAAQAKTASKPASAISLAARQTKQQAAETAAIINNLELLVRPYDFFIQIEPDFEQALSDLDQIRENSDRTIEAVKGLGRQTVAWSEPTQWGGGAFTLLSVVAFLLEMFFLYKKLPLISNRVWKAIGDYPPIAWFGGMATLVTFYGTVAGVDYHTWFRFLLAVWLIVLTHFFWQAEAVYRAKHPEPAPAT